jgi:hypothetical protein
MPIPRGAEFVLTANLLYNSAVISLGKASLMLVVCSNGALFVLYRVASVSGNPKIGAP